MAKIEYNKRKHQITVTELALEEALPKLSKLPYTYVSDTGTLVINAPESLSATAFSKTVILTPTKWVPTAESDSAVLFRNKQLVIFEVRQRACVGYTIAVQEGEVDG